MIVSHLSANNRAIHGVLGAIRDFVPPGETGVFIFFFISGYVVSGTCLDELARTGGYSIRGFYIRRLWRIVPPLLIYATFCLALGAKQVIDFSLMNYVGTISYLGNINFPNDLCGWYGGHTWSLAFEEQFYLLFPLTFAWVELSRRPNRAALPLLLCLAALPFILPLDWIGRSGFVVIYGLFAAGYLTSRYKARILPVIKRLAPLAFAVACLAVFIVPGLLTGRLGWAHRLSFVLWVPVLVLSSQFLTGTVARLLDAKVVGYVGKVSYSVYLWQQLVTSRLSWETSAFAQLGLVTAVLVGSMILYETVERPLIRYGRRQSYGV